MNTQKHMYGMVQIILIYNGQTTIYIFKITTIYYIQKWLSLIGQ